MGWTLKELEKRMTVTELMEHAASDRLDAQDHKRAIDQAKTRGGSRW